LEAVVSAAKKRDGLFAKMGLQLVSHQGALVAGEAAMGLYMYCLLYSRTNELDGFVPTEAAERGWGGDVDANRSRLQTLCSERVRYMRRVEHGYQVEKYSEFNETKAEVAKRRAETKSRVSKLRARSVTRYTAVTSTVTNAFVPVSDSVSVSVSSLSSPEPELPPTSGSPRDAFVEEATSEIRIVAAKPSRARGRAPQTFITDNWQPSAANLASLAAEGHGDASAHVREFVDYWLGVGKPMADWNATFRNRVRELAKRAPRFTPKLVQGIPASGRAWKLPEGL
jgi:hypothetical protein